jgi:hypothetical protein
LGSKNKELESLVKELFPQVRSLLGGVNYYNSNDNPIKELRICTSNLFDSYFNFIPGGSDSEITNYELVQISKASSDIAAFSSILKDYKESGKFENLIGRMQAIASDDDFFHINNIFPIFLSFFNFFDNLPESQYFFSFGLEREIVGILLQLLKRETDINKNLNMLVEVVQKTTCLYAPIYFFGITIPSEEKVPKSGLFHGIIPDESIEKIKKVCVDKIITSKENLVKQKNFLFILYRWKNWDKDGEFSKFIKDCFETDEKFLAFFDNFKGKTYVSSMGSTNAIKRFYYKELNDFGDLNEIKTRIKEIKNNQPLYEKHKSAIDLFLENFDKRDKDPLLGI